MNILATQCLGNSADVYENGSRRETATIDIDAAQYLDDILKELKKMNVQFSIITDNSISNTEVS